MTRALARTLGLAALAIPLLHLPVSASDVVVSDTMRGSDVIVRTVTLRGTVVSGFVANQSDDVVSDTQLLINYIWLWNDERNPGTDNPGRTEMYTLPTEIPTGSAVPFEHQPSPPLPLFRTDGRFTVDVKVVGFTQIGQ